MYKCKILLDSISPTGKRLTTFEITFPRIVLAEFNTHRMFSRNSASSRAIPFIRQLERVNNDPFIPERFPINDKGMQPNKYYEQGSIEYQQCSFLWLSARDKAVNHATQLVMDDSEIGAGLKVHKQIANRLLESFMWHTVIVTATEFDNFFKLRTHSDAQYEIRKIADLMYIAYHAFNKIEKDGIEWWHFPEIKNVGGEWTAIRPQNLKIGEWHCPLVYEEDELAILYYVSKQDTENGEYQRKAQYKNFKSPEIGSLDNGSDEELHMELIKIKKEISVARCARISYLTHDGKRDIEKDLELFERLRISGHWSPFEHVATPYLHKNEYNDTNNKTSGNFIGWKQFRKEFADENCTNFGKE